ncbi:MAG: pseudouridine synthase [Oscillospiraceae bacterium]
MRLDKFISSQLNISRKDARAAILRGRAAVDGTTVRAADFKIDENADSVTFDGQALSYKKHIYIIMNKPRGVLSASDDKRQPTVIDIIPEKLRRNGLFPVGRLDKDTTGLLIITDDGDFAHRVLSPKKEIFKTYIAVLDGEITSDMPEKFLNGIVLADGTKCRRAFLRRVDKNTAEIKICEGKFHQIKRMFGTVGLGVNALERTAVGNFYLPEDLPQGACSETDSEALESIFSDG